MLRVFSPQALARSATRHPWLVIASWVVVLVAAIGLGTRIGDVLTTDGRVYSAFEAEQGQRLIDRHFGHEPAHEYVIIVGDGTTVDDPAFVAYAERLTSGLRELGDNVATVNNYYESGDEGLVSAGRDVLLVPVTLAGDVHPVMRLVTQFNAEAGFTTVIGGSASIEETFIETSERDLRTAEMVGLPIALVVLVIVFGALVAAGLPIIIAIAGIVTAVGITAIIGTQFELSFFVISMITMIGLAVGIDYSLLIVQRFREERRNGLSRDAAIAKTGATASRAVLFSGMAVIVALSGMLLIPDSVFRSLATGAIVVVIAAVAAALTLLPAVLRLVGDRVNTGTLRVPFRKRSEDRQGRVWNAVTGFVMRHALVSAIASTGLLLAASVAYLGIELGSIGINSLPANSSSRQAFEILDREFNAGVLAPTEIVVRGNPEDPAVAQGIERLRALLAGDERFGHLTVEVSEDGAVTLLSLPAVGDPNGDLAQQTVRDLRDTFIPAAFGAGAGDVFVTGIAAYNMDYSALLATYTPYVFALVLGLSFLILLVVFRSIVVPLKAIVMNLLSVGAAYGILVLVFQHGVGAGLFGFERVDRIEAWVPLFMFSILFGLSMDYHVFLLSRIRERFNETGNNRESVAYGVRSTAGLITGAAAIMVAVFSGFAMGDIVSMQQMGFGLAVSVLIDATVVRVVLVPASMALLGKANWYLPSWLAWIPNVDVEGAGAAHPETEPVAATGAPMPVPADAMM